MSHKSGHIIIDFAKTPICDLSELSDEELEQLKEAVKDEQKSRKKNSSSIK